MRLRSEVIGALNLFSTEVGSLDVGTLRLGQALADVATIGLLQARAAVHRNILAERLQSALNSRVVIEQAKGVVAERRGLDMDQAFTLLRSHARKTNRGLSDLALAIVRGTETSDAYALRGVGLYSPQCLLPALCLAEEASSR
jgi:hypothetical protein